MNIREAIKKRLVVEVLIDIPEIPTIRVKRLSLTDMLDLEKAGGESSPLLVLQTIVDEHDQPVFANVAEVTADWRLYQAMLKASIGVNDLRFKVEEAEKN